MPVEVPVPLRQRKFASGATSTAFFGKTTERRFESLPSDTKVVELFYCGLNTGVEEKCLADVEQIGSAAAKLQSNGEEGKRLRNFYQSYLSMVENLTF